MRFQITHQVLIEYNIFRRTTQALPARLMPEYRATLKALRLLYGYGFIFDS